MSDSTAVVRAIPTNLVMSPAGMIEAGSAMAKSLADLIEKQKLYSMISGRKYVRVEGWTPLARMNGVIPREVSNEAHTDGHYVARVQLVKIDDGTVLTEASAECGGPQEPMWQSRAPYARRSMAATRATGKACRLAYSWIMALAGYEATPLEEMPDEKRKEVDEKRPPLKVDDELIRVSEYKGKTYYWLNADVDLTDEELSGCGFTQGKPDKEGKRGWFTTNVDAVAELTKLVEKSHA